RSSDLMVSLLVEAVLLIVESITTLGSTWTTRVRVRVPVGTVAPAQVQLTGPVPPTDGCVPHVPPADGVADTKVVFAGRPVSLMTRFWASDGPPFVAVIV